MAGAAAPSLFDQAVRGWRGYVLIALIALTSSLFGAASLPVMDRDEARFAQATRQMVETGDYVRIRVQDDDRNKKPIGIHWLQAAAVHLTEPFTDSDNEIWPYRLPSALGAVLAALAAFWAGTALLGRRAAFLGAALFASSVLLGFEGMTAKTDAVLAGFTTLAMAALARLSAQRIWSAGALAGIVASSETSAGEAPALHAGASIGRDAASPHPLPPPLKGRGLALLFWFALGCGVLVKGPITPLVALLTLLALGLWEKNWAWMKPLRWWPGPLIAALIIAPWMIAIGLATDGQFFIEAFTQDLAPKLAGGQEGHFAPPGVHLVLLPLLIFPASYALPFAARLGWGAARAARSDPAHAPLRFLLAWIIPSFVLFELMPTKLAHYTLPLFPAIALLCGAGMLAAQHQRWGLLHVVGVALFAAAATAIVGLIGFGATFMPGDAGSDLRRATMAALIGGGVALLAAGALIFVKAPVLRVSVLALCALALSFGLRAQVLPEARTLLISSEAVAALTRARLTPRPDRPLWVVGYRETSLVFMTDTAIELADAAELGAGVHVGDTLIVEARETAAVNDALERRGFAFAATGAPVSGLNVGNGDGVTLFVGSVVVPPRPIEFNGELAGDQPPDPEPPPAPRRQGRR